MGKYINVIDDMELPSDFEGKCQALLDAGAKEVNGEHFRENLVCVVDNFVFAAAGYAYDEHEYEVFRGEDGRPKRWFVIENAEELVD